MNLKFLLPWQIFFLWLENINMAKTSLSCCFLSFLIVYFTYVEPFFYFMHRFIVCLLSYEFIYFPRDYIQGKTWCVAQVGASPDRLNAFINEVCPHLACEPIRRGGKCFEPDNAYNHGSYALNLNYRFNGQCDLSFATFAVTDPCKLFFLEYFSL